jgi:hypothetical protein
MGNDKNGMNRRELLTGAALLGASALVPTPVERLLHAMTKGFIRQAEAAANAAGNPRNYVSIYLPGGPMAFCYDQFLRLSPNDPANLFNTMVVNKFVTSNGKIVGGELATFSYNNVLVPHMFSHTVKNSAGGDRPLTDILNNMLVIRGYGSGIDGHPFNAAIQQTPLGGLPSISGVAADQSSRFFEALQYPDRGPGGFVSAAGKAQNKVSGTTPLNSLLEGFGPPATASAKGRSLKDRNADAYALAQARLKTYAQGDFAGSQILAQNFSNASDLMKKGINNIAGYWSDAVTRYSNIVLASMRQSNLPGISDIAVVSDQTAPWVLNYGSNPYMMSKNFDLRTTLPSLSPGGNFIQGLALAEYVLTQGLVTSLELEMGYMQGVNVMSSDGVMHGIQMETDMHFTGAMTAMFFLTSYYRALAAGILGLSDVLKANTTAGGANLWNETVIHCWGEFSRSPRNDGTGCDHGFNQMVSSVYSGCIQNGPLVVGNIHQNGIDNANNQGSQGLGAPIDGYSQTGTPTPAMMASTITELLRVPNNPFVNQAVPLVSCTDSGGVKVLFPPKIVA